MEMGTRTTHEGVFVVPTVDSTATLRARIAANASWAVTHDRSARTAPARAALLAKFEAEVDPEGVLAPDERQRRAAFKRRAYFQRLAFRSAQARRKAASLVDEAEAELKSLGGGSVAA